MNQASSLSPMNRIKRLVCYCCLLLMAGLLSGCTRPSDDDISQLLSEKYKCKGLEVVDMVKTDSLPGIFTYVGQYNFLVRLKYPEERDAILFYRNLIKLADIKGNDWQAGLYAPKLLDYFLDECEEAGQTVSEVMLEDVLLQLEKNEKQIKLPITVQMNGWSEFMPTGQHDTGWRMTIQRDRFSQDVGYGPTVKRAVLLQGTGKR